MENTLKVINGMERLGVIGKYAIGGGIAAVFYMEPVLTYDLDVFFIPAKENSGIVLLSPIYDYIREKGYRVDKEHIVIEGIPVQFIPVYNELTREAVENAVEKKYGKVKTRIFRAEHLAAIMIQTFRPKDRERMARFLVEVEMEAEYLEEILDKHGLKEKYESFRRINHE